MTSAVIDEATLSQLDEGYYLARMHAAMLEDDNNSDFTVLYFDKQAFYSFGTHHPVMLEDLAELVQTKMDLAALYRESQASTPTNRL